MSDPNNSFVHLHLHTQYSLLDGAIRIKDLCKKAAEYGMPAVAQTDHGNMFGAIDFYTTARANGVKPILGSEIYFTPGSRHDRRPPKKGKILASQDEEEGKFNIHHLILLCKNNIGYQNLCKLLSKAYMEGFYYKPRADVEILREFSEGLIATTACLKGEVGYNFFTDQDDRAGEAIKKLQDIFRDDFYLEIQENGIPEQTIVNQKVIKFAKERSIPIVATNDCHYLDADDAAAQEVLLCVQTGKTFNDEQRMKLSTNEFYFKSAEKMRQAFNYVPEACDNTLRIAEKCNVKLSWKDDKGNQIYHLPNFEITTEETTEQFLRRISHEGLEKRFNGPQFKKIIVEADWHTRVKQTYLDRLDDELGMIIKMGFAGYFLIVSDFIKWAKQNGIPVGPGRGSGAGSLVAYALDITNINPIPFNLLFERFINPERVSLPDFDIDFCQNRRGEVIQYVTKKYGEERVGQIITFGKLQAKAVIKDVSRVYGLPFAEANIISKLIPDELGISIDKALETEPKLNELIDKDPKVKQIIKISRKLEGLLRHASIHAAGVIITNQPLVTYCPLFKGRDGERVVQFDKDFSEMIGLVKFDFLGLKTLTVIESAVKFIRAERDPLFDIENIDLDDSKVYKFISDGHTIGVFQLESSGMIDLCKRLKPDNIEDITAINALYRPGPIQSGMVDDFIEIKHGRKEMSFPFQELAPVLKDTYGVVVYQEQVMNIARIIAGYSLGQADMLRRAMGKKKKDVMDEHRKIFLEGAIKNNFDARKAGELFDLMAMFAEYGFNKSHAVAYALIAYQTAFLKCYYPAEFFASLLSTELSNSDKVTQYIQDAKTFKIEVLPPDINESQWLFSVVGEKIRFGMGAVKNVGLGAVEEIIKERKLNGNFNGFIDFCVRVDHKGVNRRMVESLIKVGAFDLCEKWNRKTLLENLELILNYAHKIQQEKEIGQTNLFDLGANSDSSMSTEDRLEINIVNDFEDQEKLTHEKELIGIYVSGHPLEKYNDILKQLSSMSIAQVHELQGNDKRQMTLCGLITDVKSFINKKGDRMAFANLEDLTSKIECIIFPKTFLEMGELINTEEPIFIKGSVNLAENPRKFFPEKLGLLKDHVEDRVSRVQLKVPMDKLNERNLDQLKQVILGFRGSVPVELLFENQHGKLSMQLGEDYFVTPSPKMAARINDLMQGSSVLYNVGGRIEDALK